MKQPRHLARTLSAMDNYLFTTFSARLLFWGLACSAILFEGIYAEDNSDGCHVFTQEAISTNTQEFAIQPTVNYVFKSVELLKQFSFQPCVPNVMYGHSLTSWWVRHGCAGEFKLEECPMHDCMILYRNGSSPHLIPRVQLATKGYHIRMMNVVEQTSFYSCDHGSTFHHNESMWWLDQGCEGIFQILECPIAAKNKALSVLKLTNQHPFVTLLPKGITDRVKVTPITSQHIPTTTKTTATPTTMTTTTTTTATITPIKKSTISSRNEIVTKTIAKHGENNANKNLPKHDSDISEEEEFSKRHPEEEFSKRHPDEDFSKRQPDEDDIEHNLANSGKADVHLLFLSFLAVLKSSHIFIYSGLD